MKQGIQRVLMMHAACMSMEGFVMLSSGDEIGQVNDYNYKKTRILLRTVDICIEVRSSGRMQRREKTRYCTVCDLEWFETDGRIQT